MKNKKILMIGYGNMGKIFYKNILKTEKIYKDNFYVVDRNLDNENDNFFLNLEDERILYNEIDIYILAIKPQDINIIKKIKNKIKKDAVMITILAGVSIEKIKSILDNNELKILRIMPNMLIETKFGIIGYTFSDNFEEKNKSKILELIDEKEKFIKCKTEKKLDKITALSGSGPAYFFEILRIFKKQAIEFGFSEKDARKIVLNTMIGSGFYAKEFEVDFNEMIKKVSSKKGTTAEALRGFKENNLEKVLRNGIINAYKRAVELNNN